MLLVEHTHSIGIDSGKYSQPKESKHTHNQSFMRKIMSSLMESYSEKSVSGSMNTKMCDIVQVFHVVFFLSSLSLRCLERRRF